MTDSCEIVEVETDLDHMVKKRRFEEVDILCRQQLAPIRGRCIELGCGGAYFSQVISRLPHVTEIVALDVSDEMIRRYRELYAPFTKPDFTKIRYVVDDMNTFGSTYGQFDTAIFCASLHHSPDQVASLEQAWRILKPGGSVILHGEHYHPVWGSPKSRMASRTNTIPQFTRLLKRTGFRPIVFRFAFSGGRHPLLKRLILTQPPFCYVNGYIKYASFMMLGRKVAQ